MTHPAEPAIGPVMLQASHSAAIVGILWQQLAKPTLCMLYQKNRRPLA